MRAHESPFHSRIMSSYVQKPVPLFDPAVPRDRGLLLGDYETYYYYIFSTYFSYHCSCKHDQALTCCPEMNIYMAYNQLSHLFT